MELHRLKEMDEDYDPALFNKLYKEMSHYMDTLAASINPKYYNVTPDVIRSWFDDKFIFVYNKYHNEMSDNSLRSHLLKSLAQVRKRYLRGAYTEDAGVNISLVYIDDDDRNRVQIEDVIEGEGKDTKTALLKKTLDDLKEILTDDGYYFLRLELNPPPQVLKPESTHITDEDWATFLGLPLEDGIYYITTLKKEISSAVTLLKKRHERRLIIKNRQRELLSMGIQ